MARCRYCGKPIDWIYHRGKGKNIAVDEEPVTVDLSGGQVEFITDEGVSIFGRLARQDAPSPDQDVAYLPHRCRTEW